MRSPARFPVFLACLPFLACSVTLNRPDWEPLRPGPIPKSRIAFAIRYEIPGRAAAARDPAAAVWARRSTVRILAEHGIDAEYRADTAGVDWIIRIREGYLPEAAQDWLTGLSLGLIPSFKAGTTLEMHFTDTRTGIRTTYPVRTLMVSHLFLAPFSVIQLGGFLIRPKGPGILVYGMALEDFLARNYPEHRSATSSPRNPDR